jgi:hypothetical protein
MLRISATVALLVIALPALAEGPEYTFAEVGFGRIDLDGLDESVDADAYNLGVSVEFGPSLQGFLNYGTADFGFDTELDEWAVGMGFHGSLSATSDFVVNLAFLHAEVRTLFGSDTDEGFGVSTGIRSMVTPKVELAGFVSYADYDSGGEFGVTGKAWYFLTRQFAIGANVGIAEDVTRYGITGRFYFGR